MGHEVFSILTSRNAIGLRFHPSRDVRLITRRLADCIQCILANSVSVPEHDNCSLTRL